MRYLLFTLLFALGFSQCIEGNCSDGEGTYKYPDGIYVGEWRDGKKEGKGVFTHTEGRPIYEGQWKNDLKNGWGEEIYTFFVSGARYRGQFKDGIKEGEGTMYLPRGGSLSGKWENGFIVKGVRTTYVSGGGPSDINHEEYNGEFKEKNNMSHRHGYGVMSYIDGEKYEGYWVYGVREGQGTCTSSNGDYYEGGWKNNEEDGLGYYAWNDGSIYVGEFHNGTLNGWGVYTIVGSFNIYAGIFVNNSLLEVKTYDESIEYLEKIYLESNLPKYLQKFKIQKF